MSNNDIFDQGFMAVQTQHVVTQRFVQSLQALLENRTVFSERQLALSLTYKPQGLNEIMNGNLRL